MTDKNKDESIVVLSTNAFEELLAYARIGTEEAGCPDKADSLYKHARKRNTWLRDKHIREVAEARREYVREKQAVKQFVGLHGGQVAYLRYDEYVVIPVKVLSVHLDDRTKVRVKELGTRTGERNVTLDLLSITKPKDTWTPQELAAINWDPSRSRYAG